VSFWIYGKPFDLFDNSNDDSSDEGFGVSNLDCCAISLDCDEGDAEIAP